MPVSHKKLDFTVNVSSIKNTLINNPELFGEYTHRFMSQESPHREVVDIWARFNDVGPYLKGDKDFATFCDEHDSVWYDVVEDIPEAKTIASAIYKHVGGVRLGGVLITKLAPGGRVYPHVDSGWHADYYKKYYVPIQNAKGAVFCFDDGTIDPQEGDIYEFDNSYKHWVDNYSEKDRIAMIVCIKTGEGE